MKNVDKLTDKELVGLLESMDEEDEMAAQSPKKGFTGEHQKARDMNLTDRLPFVQEIACRIQSHLEIHNTSEWPKPVNEEATDTRIEANKLTIQDALEGCKDYALEIRRVSSKKQFIDDSVKGFKTRAFGKNELGDAGNGESVPTKTVVKTLNEAKKAEPHREVTAKEVKSEKGGQSKQMNGEAEKPENGSSDGNVEEMNSALEGKDALKDVEMPEFAQGNGPIADLKAPRLRNPPVPQPLNMPDSITKALCSHAVQAYPILSLTLVDQNPLMSAPMRPRAVLLHHFEVGLDGVEALCHGQVKTKETKEVLYEREKRVQQMRTLKKGDGGFYHALKTEQESKGYGQGWWVFYGVKFKQTPKEKKCRKGGKWMCFALPIEAQSPMSVAKRAGSMEVTLGGGKWPPYSFMGFLLDDLRRQLANRPPMTGKGRCGKEMPKRKANTKRVSSLFSRGGVAPMDIWQGGEDWEDGVFEDIKRAMAKFSLRISFLYEDGEDDEEV